MAYEIYPDGRVRADTADEIINLWSKLKKPATETTVSQPTTEVFKKPETEVSRPSCTEDSWILFTRALSAGWLTPHQQILTTLKKQDGPIDRDAFRHLLGPMFRSNNVLGGMIGGISRQARKAGLDLNDVVIRQGAKYRPGPLLSERALPWEDAA